MKNTSRKTARATRPTLVVDAPALTAVPGSADAPAEVEMEFKVEADAELYDTADGQIFARWSVTRSRCRGVTETDDGSGIAISVELSNSDTRTESFHLFGGHDSHWRELSVEQFRRFVAALNAVAAQLPITAPTTIRVAR